MLILGLNLFHADSSAALIEDGKVVFAIAEERLNRVKHYAGFPKLAIAACLGAIGANLSDVDHVAIGRDSDANLARKIQYVATNPRKILNFLQIRQRREALNNVCELMAQELQLDASAFRFQEHHIEHHLAHIASAYYCSGWDSAAGFSYDGSGDFVTAMFARCVGEQIEVLERVFVPHSLGSFYTMLCEFLGYCKYGDEGKVMGLAPYGRSTYCDAVRKIVPLHNGTFHLDLDYFMPLGSTQGMTIKEDGTVQLARHYSPRMIDLLGPPRLPHGEITQRDMDIAYAMQQRFEEVFLHLLKELHRRTP